MEPSGKIYQIYVPVHALTNKACSHDATLQKQIHALIAADESSQDQDEKFDQILTQLKSVKSSVTKLGLVLQIFTWQAQQIAFEFGGLFLSITESLGSYLWMITFNEGSEVN